MNKTLTVLILLATLVIVSGWTSRSANTSYIHWDETRKLSWDDFRGVVNEGSHADAATAVHISANPFRHKKRLFYRVDAYFVPEKSWRRSTSESLLRHEQLHFDIAELYARKARKKISEYRQMGIRDIDEYNRAIAKILQESNRVDIEYDFNTLHGTLSDRQIAWEKTIAMELEILLPFSRSNWK